MNLRQPSLAAGHRSTRRRRRPGSLYRAVAELPPVYWDETSKVWVCRGYAEVSAVLRDHNRFRSGRRHSSDTLDARGMGDATQVQQLLDEQLLFLDPPDHATARDALRTAFTPAATAAREPVVAGIVRDLPDRLPRHGPVDVVGAYAGPLPTRLNAARLGLTDRVDQGSRGAADAAERLMRGVLGDAGWDRLPAGLRARRRDAGPPSSRR